MTTPSHYTFITIITIDICVWLYRNQAYHTRIKLAVLDHNAHIDRNQAKTKNGKLMYHCKYRKSSKKWDVTPTMNHKEYKYIEDIFKNIHQYRTDSTLTTRHKSTPMDNHPCLIQKTIGHVPPDTTDDLVRNKRSRFQ